MTISGQVAERSTLPGEPESAIAAKATSENFPVALRLLPRRHRAHLMALYGYARLVDDIGDELVGSTSERLAMLDAAEAELEDALAGRATHPVFVSLQEAIAGCGLSEGELKKLIEANRVDQQVSSYETFDQLLGYCKLSADPVGRLVLQIFGAATEENYRLSDLVCTSLQLVEHFQDVAEDAGNGRIYLPTEDLEGFGVPRHFPAGEPAPAAFRRMMAFEVARTRKMLTEGSGLLKALHGWSRFAIAGFVAGGAAQLEAIEQARFDVLSAPVKASDRHVAAQVARLVAGSSFAKEAAW